MKISARNRFVGTVEKVEKGSITSLVKVKIQTPITVTALISKEAAEDLALKRGDKSRLLSKGPK